MSLGTLFLFWVYKMKPRFSFLRCKQNCSHVETWPGRVKMSTSLAFNCVLLFSMSKFLNVISPQEWKKKLYFQFNSSSSGKCLAYFAVVYKNQPSQIEMRLTIQWAHQCISGIWSFLMSLLFLMAACLCYMCQKVMSATLVVATRHLLTIQMCQT